ncbi:glycosyltransferase [Microcoleus sp. T2B6]|uniref:glycosyltransferase n=1 Tax=Microcoleus sp. T2B6 TaxID=3055424 RepID=UPI002FD36DAF
MKNVSDLILESNNDYSKLEKDYQIYGYGSLVLDPYNSIKQIQTSLSFLSVSIIIPSYNCRDTVIACLKALGKSSFNNRHSDQLEVIVVDDGSSDGTFEALIELRIGLKYSVMRQAHLGRAHAMNTGIAASTGDIIISCDADMILSVHTISELVKRHSVLEEEVVLVGFRSNIHDVSLDIAQNLVGHLPKFWDDNRYHYDWPGWPENMMQVTKHLKLLGDGRKLWLTDTITPSDEIWTLPRMVYGALFSMRRSLINRIGGFEEKFQGWGWEDTWIGTLAICEGALIIPVPSATGYHLDHPDRSPSKWEESRQNFTLIEQLSRQSLNTAKSNYLENALARIVEHYENRFRCYEQELTTEFESINRIKKFLADEANTAFYHFCLGQYKLAISYYCEAQEMKSQDLANYARCYFEIGNPNAGLEVLAEALQCFPDDPLLLMESIWHYARLNKISTAKKLFYDMLSVISNDPICLYLLRHSPEEHTNRGWKYLQQGFVNLAWRDFTAALLLDCDYQEAHYGWEQCDKRN